ncbi:MAG: thermonuclease family protein [Hyphomicrobiaceae bacterium]
MRYATRQAGALAIAGLLAVPLLATQGYESTSARGVAPSSGSTVAGAARVVDGDTIVIGDVRVRLEGIDAPETSQNCSRSLIGNWACGHEAARHLDRLVRGRQVECRSVGADRYGRMLGICTVAGRDINAAMIRDGMAWAFVRYSTRYVGIEAQARQKKLGIWQGKAQRPWDYRAEQWTSAEAASRAEAPAGCVIKGNITNKGRLYHTPWSHWYARTKIDTAKGERWFCNEAEAVAAGWRPASIH